MKILSNTNDLTISMNTEQDFKTDLGWQENAQELEDQTLEKIINPVDNYETVRYIHQPYDSLVSGSTVTLLQSDIWFRFSAGSSKMVESFFLQQIACLRISICFVF